MKQKAAKVPRPERLKSYHHGDLKAALIAAAADMLERDGPEAISFRAVARATGVSQAAPYNHFQNKEDLLSALAAAGFRELTASQAAAAQTAQSCQERIAAFGLDYVGFALAHPQLYRLMFGVGVSDWCAHPAVMEAKAASFHPIREVVREHLGGSGTSSDTETAGIAAWALVHGLSMLLLDRSLDPARKAAGHSDDLIKRVVTSFAVGLRQD